MQHRTLDGAAVSGVTRRGLGRSPDKPPGAIFIGVDPKFETSRLYLGYLLPPGTSGVERKFAHRGRPLAPEGLQAR